jgi:hypothetical protein
MKIISDRDLFKNCVFKKGTIKNVCPWERQTSSKQNEKPTFFLTLIYNKTS